MSSLLKSGEFSLGSSKHRVQSPEEPTCQEETPRESPAQGEVDLETLRNVAYQEGYTEGLESGRRDALTEVQSLREEAARFLEEAKAEAAMLLENARPAVLKLALDIARKVIRDEVSTRPEVLLQIAGEALERVRGETSVSLRVNPRDVVIIEEAKNGLLDDNPGLGAIRVEEDPLVEPGGCVVAGSRGRVDATVDGQLKRIARVLEEEVGPDD